jgi:hypothetical protein
MCSYKKICNYGEGRLKYPQDVDQLQDGRVIVSECLQGHGVVVFDHGDPTAKMTIAAELLAKPCGLAASYDSGFMVSDMQTKVEI